MTNEDVSMKQIVETHEKINRNIDNQPVKTDQQMNRRAAATEADSIEKLFHSFQNYLEEQFHSVEKRLDLIKGRIDSIGERLNLLQETAKPKHDTKINKSKKQMTADEILEAIENMENHERWKLIYELYFLYYNKDGHEYIPYDELDLDY